MRLRCRLEFYILGALMFSSSHHIVKKLYSLLCSCSHLWYLIYSGDLFIASSANHFMNFSCFSLSNLYGFFFFMEERTRCTTRHVRINRLPNGSLIIYIFTLFFLIFLQSYKNRFYMPRELDFFLWGKSQKSRTCMKNRNNAILWQKKRKWGLKEPVPLFRSRPEGTIAFHICLFPFLL